jgi:hypothetical protein
MKLWVRFFTSTKRMHLVPCVLCLVYAMPAHAADEVPRAAVTRGVAPLIQQNMDQRTENRGQVAEQRVQVSRNLPTQQGQAQTVSRVAVTPQVSQNIEYTESAAQVPAPAPIAARAATVSRVLPTQATATAAPGAASVRSATAARGTTAAAPQGIAQMARAAFHENEKGITNADPSIRRAGLSLRPTVAEVGGRAVIAGTGQMTGSNVGANAGRVAVRADRAGTRTPVTPESIAEITERLTAMGDLTTACQQQYRECMDQFCNVLDANQGRCTCSDRLAAYSRIEATTRQANDELNEVAQRIRYVGLTADEIRAIMSATEAELALQGARDVTENRAMLDQIESLIRDPESFVVASNSAGFGMDMNIDFALSGDPAEMFNLDNLFGTGGGTFANMRGTQLLSAAQRRCENVLTACRRVGVNVAQITARYEMEIDRDCVNYERGLERMNQTLRTNVRTATQMLQQARLAVMQNQNQFDARGCIGQLERCMMDEMVCGRDFVKCIDPTKRFIDENGNVVLGQDIAQIRQMMSTFNVAGIPNPIPTHCPPNDTSGQCIISFLLERVGTGQTPTTGMCRAVMSRCRAVTYDRDGNFNTNNEVLRTFIQRAMVNIRASQERVISDFAMSCMQDVAFCYSQQVSQISAWSSTASVDHVYQVMRGACRNVALTCGFAIFAAPDIISACTSEANAASSGSCRCQSTATGTIHITPNNCIDRVSDMFYQSMLCPENSTFGTPPANEVLPSVNGSVRLAANLTGGWVNARCRCNGTFMVVNGSCVSAETCPFNASVGATGGAITGFAHCRCNAGFNNNAGFCGACPARSTLDATATATNNGDLTTRGVVRASPVSGNTSHFCRCDYVGTANNTGTNNGCPLPPS